jgi:anti-sigma28 factor (negative regulator of flagellin synthesis)
LTKVQQLRELIACGRYEVDSDAVAAAILQRLLKRNEEERGDARLA